MVSQANFFRDDLSGELYPTPAEAIASERESKVWMREYLGICTMDTTTIKNISANYMSARQAENDGAPKRELRHLLFAAQDIMKLLKAPRTSGKDAVMARQYAGSLIHTSIAIEHLLMEELNARNTR